MPPINFFGSFGNTDFPSRHGTSPRSSLNLAEDTRVPGRCIRLAHSLIGLSSQNWGPPCGHGSPNKPPGSGGKGWADGLIQLTREPERGSPGPKSHAGWLVGWPYVPRFKNRIACSRLAPSSSASTGTSFHFKRRHFTTPEGGNLCALFCSVYWRLVLSLSPRLVPAPRTGCRRYARWRRESGPAPRLRPLPTQRRVSQLCSRLPLSPSAATTGLCVAFGAATKYHVRTLLLGPGRFAPPGPFFWLGDRVAFDVRPDRRRPDRNQAINVRLQERR